MSRSIYLVAGYDLLSDLYGAIGLISRSIYMDASPAFRFLWYHLPDQ